MATLTLNIPTEQVDRIKEAFEADDVAGVKAVLIQYMKNRVRDHELDVAMLQAALTNLDVT